ncbi:hypothetical protein [Caballeronia novacaledonica]|uniref:Uncharacterized protein n=1 Tax=Caballeronia novacaledonica TaxID=1544861 RepID=A0AA37I7B9_9BURK|nr:hypothetical protein [Caballeronia novacaledonica]GJH23812.1 hypothetical protein CBA19CS42_04870 [Caballeronia novacaledonica]
MGNGSRLEVHYYLTDDLHTMDALVRNRCEADFLAAVAYIAESLGARVHFEATVPTEGGFRDFWQVAFDKDNRAMSVNALVALLTLLINQAVATWNAPPRPNPELERQQIEINHLTAKHMRLENERSELEIKKLERDLAKTETPAPLASSPDVSERTVVPKIPDQTSASRERPKGNADENQPLGLQMDPKVNKRRSNFYKQLVTYERVTAVGFRWLPENGPPSTERIVPRSDFNGYLLQTDVLPPETFDAVVEIVSPVITQGDMLWKGRWNGQTISFAMDDKAFKAEVIYKKMAFQHGDSIRCELETERKLDEGGNAKVTAYRVLTVYEKMAGGEVQETPQGRRRRHEARYADSQADMFRDAV